ncbi:MAG: hypothetical protein ACRDIB_08295, partial [Ardenticatenaceae bacterium]
PLDPPRDVVLTNLVYHPTYPVLMASLADYLLAGPAGGLAGASVAPGEALTIPFLDAEVVEIETQDGKSEHLPANEGAPVVSYVPTRPGIYSVRWPGSEQGAIHFTVNLFAPSESDIAPVPELVLTTRDDATPAGNALAGEARRDLWRPLLLVGLLILAIEWLVYQRDALLRLRRLVMRNA